MRFRLTIGRKIGLGFGFLILLIIVVFGATFIAVNKGIDTFEESNENSSILIELITPSKEKVNKLKQLVGESKQLAIQWVSVTARDDEPHKNQFRNYLEHQIPRSKQNLIELSQNWKDSNNIALFDTVQVLISELDLLYHEIMEMLPDIESYTAINIFYLRPYITQGGDILVLADQIDLHLRNLLRNLEKQEEALLKISSKSTLATTDTFEGLRYYWILGGLLICLAIFIAIFTTKSIVSPVRYLRRVLLALGKGIIPKKTIKVSNDEIGDMSQAMNQLVTSLQKTTSFAREVGQSKFDSLYEPLSDEDELGHALLVMRDELRETEENLERKVKERTEEVVKQRDEIEKQRGKLQELYKDVTDSIVYAKRLQNTILPSPEKVRSICPDSMVLYKPKDIVSGDFYWFEEMNNKSLFAVVDCTGHGVPGAFMSILGSNGLNSALGEAKLDKPSEILDHLNKSIYESLHKNGETEDEVRDGMDVAICSIDYSTLTLEYSGANNALYIIRDNEFIITKADKRAIGSFQPGTANYTNHTIPLKQGDMVYIFSDGYPDQFGGPRGRKLMYNNFREYLLLAKSQPIDSQAEFLNQKLVNWQGQMDQVDDILLIGLKI